MPPGPCGQTGKAVVGVLHLLDQVVIAKERFGLCISEAALAQQGAAELQVRNGVVERVGGVLVEAAHRLAIHLLGAGQVLLFQADTAEIGVGYGHGWICSPKSCFHVSLAWVK